ncbi:hypothetical protein [Lacisediminihabitans changchengi]|uniref:Uncharacterized protein n=1 Tax=Lacisediminihabitans changchengi TaxID=2787634 RepID=A0A934SG60_9MICO|nr:hypothetical protein [Lacisediminihabitans changchengi]MBK4346026.1 hypothetical protein [Lacisediminihabitans changchengi]
MPQRTNVSPDLIPVLGRGRHRTPKSGACFMEFASYLAGERWSDHPACTHPALAALARLVNDCSSDSSRGRLVTLVPSVVGLLGDGRRTTVRLSVLAVTAALPIASFARQRALAAGGLRLQTLLAEDDALSIGLDGAFADVPDAHDWALRFTANLSALDERVTDRMCDSILRTAVVGIAEACIPDADDRMLALLEAAIAEVTPAVVPAVPSMPARRLHFAR